MAPVIISNEMTVRLPYGSTMESSHIVTLNISVLIKQASHIQNPPKMKTDPLISLGFLCDYGYNITL